MLASKEANTQVRPVITKLPHSIKSQKDFDKVCDIIYNAFPDRVVDSNGLSIGPVIESLAEFAGKSKRHKNNRKVAFISLLYSEEMIDKWLAKRWMKVLNRYPEATIDEINIGMKALFGIYSELGYGLKVMPFHYSMEEYIFIKNKKEKQSYLRTIEFAEQNKANYLYNMGYYEQAAQNFKKLASNRNNGLSILAGYYNNIGLCYNRLKVWDSARVYFNRSLWYSNKVIKNSAGGADSFLGKYHMCFRDLVYANMAVEEEAKGNYEYAIDNYKKEAQSGTSLKLWAMVIQSYQKLAGVYIEQGKLRQGRLYLDSAENHPFTQRSDIYKLDVLRLKVKLYESTNTKKANEIYKKCLRLQDTITKDQNEIYQFFSDFSLKVLVEGNKTMAKANRGFIARLNEKQRTYVFTVLCIGILSLSLITLLIYRSNKAIKQKDRTLKSALDHKQLLLKEIHHRVKNNFQIVTGLIELGLHDLDTKDLPVVRKLTGNIKAMSLIHDLHYKGEDMEYVNVQVYFRSLVNHSIPQSQYPLVEKQLKIASRSISLEHCIPLGLILSELLQNSLKYAFKDGIGKIAISFKPIDSQNVCLTYHDSSEKFDLELLKNKTNGTGYSLIESFVNELEGTFSVEYDQGLKYTFHFSLN